MYLNKRKWIYLDIRNPFKTMKKLKGVFKPLKCYFKWNTNEDWFPMLWYSNPAYIHIMSVDVGWKDKFDSPRYEYPPAIWIHLFKWNFIWYWSIEKNDQYWEQALWYLYYSGTISQGLGKVPNIDIARKNWPWQDMKGNSTWKDKFLVK